MKQRLALSLFLLLPFQLLTIAVLSIILMAPAGAILISLAGPKLLERESRPTTDNNQSEPPRAGREGGGEDLAEGERMMVQEKSHAL